MKLVRMKLANGDLNEVKTGYTIILFLCAFYIIGFCRRMAQDWHAKTGHGILLLPVISGKSLFVSKLIVLNIPSCGSVATTILCY